MSKQQESHCNTIVERHQVRQWKVTLSAGFLLAFLLYSNHSHEQFQEIAEKVFRIRSERGKWDLLVQRYVGHLTLSDFSMRLLPHYSWERIVLELRELLDAVFVTPTETECLGVMDNFKHGDIFAVSEKTNQERPWRETLILGFLQAFLLYPELSQEQFQEIAEKIVRIESEHDKWRLLVQRLAEDSCGSIASGVFLTDDSPEKAISELNSMLDIVLTTHVEQTWLIEPFY
jgi:hypothetical protein